jgi:hypothetical protein
LNLQNSLHATAIGKSHGSHVPFDEASAGFDFDYPHGSHMGLVATAFGVRASQKLIEEARCFMGGFRQKDQLRREQ